MTCWWRCPTSSTLVRVRVCSVDVFRALMCPLEFRFFLAKGDEISLALTLCCHDGKCNEGIFLLIRGIRDLLWPAYFYLYFLETLLLWLCHHNQAWVCSIAGWCTNVSPVASRPWPSSLWEDPTRRDCSIDWPILFLLFFCLLLTSKKRDMLIKERMVE